MATTMPVNMEALLTLTPVDDKGNPAALENIRWALNSNAAAIFPSADGMTAFFVPGDVGGSTVQVTATGDARIGDGVRELMATEDFNLVSAEAVSMGFSVGPLQPKTAH